MNHNKGYGEWEGFLEEPILALSFEGPDSVLTRARRNGGAIWSEARACMKAFG